MAPETGAFRRHAGASSVNPVQEPDVDTQVTPARQNADANGTVPIGMGENGAAAVAERDELFEPATPDPTAPGSGTMIVFERVTKIYEPNVVALNDVSFAIDKGEFVFVVG